MDELSYQLDVSDTFTYSDEASSDENIAQDNFEDFQLDLCHACAQSLPVELEDCLQRQRNIEIPDEPKLLMLKFTQKAF